MTISGAKKRIQKDLKVYTVGEHFAHAEARKSPEVDGLVERTPDGREVRHIVKLTAQEELIASTIVRCFKQRICGFDVLRRQKGDSYVCDVNGWSFVKGNTEYYDQCGKILSEMFTQKVRKIREKYPAEKAPLASHWKLRGSVHVFRHADRTPKQKVKIKFTHPRLLALFEGRAKELKMKSDKNQAELSELLSIIVEILDTPADDQGRIPGFDGHDSVIRLQLVCAVLSNLYQGLKIQIKPLHTQQDGDTQVTRALMVCKWGGMLTKQGEYQAWRLGKSFRNQFVAGTLDNAHPLQYYMDPPPYISSNNERRVKRTAELVGAGLLGKRMDEPARVEDNEETNHVLGDINNARDLIDNMKQTLSEIIHAESMDEVKEYLTYCGVPPLEEMARTPAQELNPLQFLLNDLSKYLKCVCRRLESLQDSSEKVPTLVDESLPLMIQRWKRLTDYIYSHKTQKFDATKIPDVEDYIKYDAIHNRSVIGDHLLVPLWSRAKVLADFIVPREYGITPEDKLRIGSLTCKPLCDLILSNIRDIMEDKPSSSLFLHFTSESHVHPLLNLLLHTQVVPMKKLDFFMELNYLTQVVFKVFEDTNKPSDDPDRFLIQLFYSAGAIGDALACTPADEHILPVLPSLCINAGVSLEQLEQIFDA